MEKTLIHSKQAQTLPPTAVANPRTSSLLDTITGASYLKYSVHAVTQCNLDQQQLGSAAAWHAEASSCTCLSAPLPRSHRAAKGTQGLINKCMHHCLGKKTILKAALHGP
eukprot:3220675-Amphidinium_carterae.2